MTTSLAATSSTSSADGRRAPVEELAGVVGQVDDEVGTAQPLGQGERGLVGARDGLGVADDDGDAGAHDAARCPPKGTEARAAHGCGVGPQAALLQHRQHALAEVVGALEVRVGGEHELVDAERRRTPRCGRRPPRGCRPARCRRRRGPGRRRPRGWGRSRGRRALPSLRASMFCWPDGLGPLEALLHAADRLVVDRPRAGGRPRPTPPRRCRG